MKKYLAILLTVTLSVLNTWAKEPDLDSLRLDAIHEKTDSVRLKKIYSISDYITGLKPIDTVLEYDNMGIELARKLGNREYEAHFYDLLAWECAYYDMPESLDYFFRALELYEEIGHKGYQLNVLCDISSYFVNANNYSLAFEYCQKAMDLAHREGISSSNSIIYNNMGNINYNMGMFEIAKNYYRKAFMNTDDSARLALYSLAIAQADFQLSSDKYTAVVNEEQAYIDMVKVRVDYADDIILLFNDMMDTYDNLPFGDSRRDTIRLKMEDCLPKMIETSSEYSSQAVDAMQLRYYIMMRNRKMADKMYSRVLDGIGNIDNSTVNDCYKALIMYFKYTGRWKEASKYSDDYNHLTAFYDNVEFSAQNEVAPSERKYREKIHQTDINARNRNLEYTQNMRYNSLAQKMMGVVAVFIVAFIISLARNHKVQTLQKELLENQTAEIMSVNEELNSQQEEILAQRDEISQHSMELDKQRRGLKRSNRRLLNSLVYAERIQRALVPNPEDIRRLFPESFVLWKPRDIVSGDFYWCYQTEGRRYLVTADCTGHGVPGALVSMLGISLLNDISYLMDGMDAGSILNLLKSRLVDALTMSTGEVSDGMDVALYIMSKEERWKSKEERRESKEDRGESKDSEEGIKNQKSKIKNILSYAGARRPLVIVRNGEVIELKPDKKSVCVDRYVFQKGGFNTQTVDLEAGDTLYTFSDGLADQMGGPDGYKKFGRKALLDLLLAVSSMPMDIQSKTIDETLTSWAKTSAINTGTGTQIDDQLIIGVRV